MADAHRTGTEAQVGSDDGDGFHGGDGWVRYCDTGRTVPDRPVVDGYANDLIALCHSREQAEQVTAALAGWFPPRGLAFNKDKTESRTLVTGVGGSDVSEDDCAMVDAVENRRIGRGREPRACERQRGSACAGDKGTTFTARPADIFDSDDEKAVRTREVEDLRAS